MSRLDALRREIAKAVVGQEEVVEEMLVCLLAGGHALLEGAPGLGKTLLVRTVARCLDLRYSRIQFTPDLMPADITGTNVVFEDGSGKREFRFEKGPIFGQVVLADEINRATPKTQSALLEAMQERQVSVGRSTYPLDEPYCVMATQNPVEQEGTYPLPEAQLDRFLMKLVVDYPAEQEYHEILDRTTTDTEIEIEPVSNAEEILELRHVVRAVPVPEHVQQHAVRLVIGTQPRSEYAPAAVKDNVVLGASPRGAQSLLLCGKVRALLDGRFAVSADDVRAVAHPVLRHRVLIGFQGQAAGVRADDVVDAVLEHVQA